MKAYFIRETEGDIRKSDWVVKYLCSLGGFKTQWYLKGNYRHGSIFVRLAPVSGVWRGNRAWHNNNWEHYSISDLSYVLNWAFFFFFFTTTLFFTPSMRDVNVQIQSITWHQNNISQSRSLVMTSVMRSCCVALVFPPLSAVIIDSTARQIITWDYWRAISHCLASSHTHT